MPSVNFLYIFESKFFMVRTPGPNVVKLFCPFSPSRCQGQESNPQSQDCELSVLPLCYQGTTNTSNLKLLIKVIMIRRAAMRQACIRLNVFQTMILYSTKGRVYIQIGWKGHAWNIISRIGVTHIK